MMHCATGKPRGRPRTLPFDFYKKVFAALQGHINLETGLVKINWNNFAGELGVSRSTLARQMKILRQCGYIESVNVPINEHQVETYYRLKGEIKE